MPTSFDSRLPAYWLRPPWQIANVKAFCSTRDGVFSAAPYNGFNTAAHVGDDPATVSAARKALVSHFGWSQPPEWLRQVHGVEVVNAASGGVGRAADAIYSNTPGQVCAIHTADCLPVFFASASGQEVALAHAGWRGLAAGILESTLQRFSASPDIVSVWLGPAISVSAFEVGDDVREAFLSEDSRTVEWFLPNSKGRWQCDLYGLARFKLHNCGVTQITGGDCCTFNDKRFFSYRRHSITGRMVSLIWIDPHQ